MSVGAVPFALIEVEEAGLFSVFDIMGRPVYSETQVTQTESIDVSGFSPGSYVGIFRTAKEGVSVVRFQVVR